MHKTYPLRAKVVIMVKEGRILLQKVYSGEKKGNN